MLAVSVLGSGIAALDATVVNIALPTIGRDFGTGVAALQWVMKGYTLTLAAFLLIGGSLGDRFGRRKVYLIGTAWFALASAACGFAPDVVFLIITRAAWPSWKPRSGPPTAPGRSAPGRAWAVSLSLPGRWSAATSSRLLPGGGSSSSTSRSR